MKALLLTLGLLSLPLASQAADGFFKQLTLPLRPGGDRQRRARRAASTGSYDVRLYSGANPSFRWISSSTARCCRAMAASREIKLLDLNGDKQPEVIVVVESAGSGSHLSADALTINPQEGWRASTTWRDWPPVTM